MKRAIGEFTLYKWRYGIGIAIGLLLAGLVFVLMAMYVPGGLRPAEQTSVIASANLSIQSVNAGSIVNLPYHFLQQISMSLFNASLLSIKLPSILFAFAALAAFYLLSRAWFRSNVAAIASVILISLPAFIFAAQDGTALMYTICLSFWLLLSAALVAREVRPTLFWKILFVVLFALNLYAPLGIYLDFALLLMAFLHPHVRHFVRRLSKIRLGIGIAIFMLLLSPLVMMAYHNLTVLFDLLGWPQRFGSLYSGATTTFRLLFDFSGNSVYAAIASPVLPLGILLLAILGIYFFIRAKHSAQSLVVALWALLLIALSVLNPANTAYLVVVLALVLAAAINGLLANWYRIFPNNPYAHVVALFPTTIIVIGLFITGIGQYAASYYYNPAVAREFSDDITLLPQVTAATTATAASPVTLVVTTEQRDFFQAIAKYRTGLIVTSTVPTSLSDQWAISHDAYMRYGLLAAPNTPSRIVTNRLAHAADRFYVYTTPSK